MGIFEDGSLESKLTTTSEGNFEFSIDNLSEGEHKFIIKLLDSNDIALMESSEIVINIDSKPPEIMNTSINPEGSVMPNTPVTITVISETGLNMIRVNIDKLIYPMEEKKESPGTYIASFPAPKEGTYPISLTLIDKNGNQSEINTNKSIIVENFTQANITNLSLKTVSKDTATIGWETSFTKEKPKNIIFEVELSKPDNTKQNFKSQGEVNEFTLTGLLPESEYNVIVRGISDNKEGPFSTPLTFKTSKPLAFENVNYSLGDGSSQIIWTTTDPTSIDKIVISYGIKDLGYIASIALDPSSKDFTIDDLIGGVNYIVKIEGMKNNVTLTSSNEISFIAAGRGLDNVSGDISGRGDCTPLEVRNLRVTENPDGSKNVIWDTIPNVDYYEIHIGSNPGENDIGIFTVGNPPFPVPFIDNDKKFHYFSVKSGCSFKKLVSDKLSQSLRVETGPALILLLLMLTISFVIGNVYYRKTI